MKVPGRVRFGVVFLVVVGALALWAGPSIGGKLFQSEPLKNPKPYKKETRATVRVPETGDIPRRGIAVKFKLVGHNPLLDGDRGRFAGDLLAATTALAEARGAVVTRP